MWIQSLELTQYRNHAHTKVDFGPGLNLILGENAQGKTNLLEAITLLSQARSNRTHNDRELIMHQQRFTTVLAQMDHQGWSNPETLQAVIQLDKQDRLKTQFKRNGVLLKSRSAVLGILPSVSFYSTDLALLRGGAEERRKWLDVAVCQLHASHFSALSVFQRLKQQKSLFLKEAQAANHLNRSLLEVINQQLATVSARISNARLHYLQHLSIILEAEYAHMVGQPQETLTLGYISTAFNSKAEQPLMAFSAMTESDWETQYLQTMALRMQDEFRRGQCLVGPHRDDIGVTLVGQSALLYASQGQQRSIVLALKLAELAMLTQKLTYPPILLMDDVMAELDQRRQQFLLEQLSQNAQVFITTTHLDASYLNQYLKSHWDTHQPGDTPPVFLEVSQGKISKNNFFINH